MAPPVKEVPLTFPTLNPSDFITWSDEIFMCLQAPEWASLAGYSATHDGIAPVSASLYRRLIQSLDPVTRPAWLQRRELTNLGLELWAALQDEFEPSSPQHLLNLHQLWSSLAIGPTEAVDHFAFRLSRLVSRLEAAGQTYCNTLQVLTFLRGLDIRRFGPFIQAFNTGSRNVLDSTLATIARDAKTFLLSNPPTSSMGAANAAGPTPNSTPSATPSTSPAVPDWFGRYNLSDDQSDYALRRFRCPIHRSNNHLLSACPSFQKYYTCTMSTTPTPIVQSSRPSASSLHAS